MSPHSPLFQAVRYASDFFFLILLASGMLTAIFGMLLVAKLAWAALLR